MLTLIALWSASALASPPTERGALREDLLLQFQELTRPGDGVTPDQACLTPLVRQLVDNWDLFSSAEKAEMTSKLAPFKADLAEPLPAPTPCWER